MAGLYSHLTHAQRINQRIADKHGTLINATKRPDLNIQALGVFDGGGDISSMKKPELVAIGKSRLVGFSAQQCETMEEITLRERLESLVRIYFFASVINAYLTQRAERRNRSLVDKNREEIAAAERTIIAPSSSSKDLGALKKDVIIAFLTSQRGPSDKARLDGMSKRDLVEEIKEWVSLVLSQTARHFNPPLAERALRVT